MTPAAIWEAVKFTVIAGALGFILLYVHRADKNADALADLKADTKQLTDNVATQARWQKEQTDANAQQAKDIGAIATMVDSQRAPILVRVPTAAAGAVPDHPAGTAGATAGCGRPDAGSGTDGHTVDIRPALNAFELKYEGYLASCRSVLAQWPH